MKSKTPQSQARLFGRAGESVTRSDRRQPELEFGSLLPPLTARPNRRRDDALGWAVQASPLEGAPNEPEIGGELLTAVGHPFISDSERRFAPTTVRQDWNGVRYGLEQVSAFIGIRILAKYDLFVASALKDLLTCIGFAVTVVSSGEAVRRLVKTDDFAAILLDSELSDVNSFALCMEMVKSCPKTLVVITSAWPDLTAEAIQAGAAAFVEKPQLSSVPGLLQKLIPLV